MRLPAPVTKRDILTVTPAQAGTTAQTPGEVRLRPRLRPVPAVLFREPVTKLRRTPTVTAVPAGTAFPAQTDIPLPNLKYVPAAQPPEPAISANRQAAANVK